MKLKLLIPPLYIWIIDTTLRFSSNRGHSYKWIIKILIHLNINRSILIIKLSVRSWIHIFIFNCISSLQVLFNIDLLSLGINECFIALSSYYFGNIHKASCLFLAISEWVIDWVQTFEWQVLQLFICAHLIFSTSFGFFFKWLQLITKIFLIQLCRVYIAIINIWWGLKISIINAF